MRGEMAGMRETVETQAHTCDYANDPTPQQRRILRKYCTQLQLPVQPSLPKAAVFRTTVMTVAAGCKPQARRGRGRSDTAQSPMLPCLPAELLGIVIQTIPTRELLVVVPLVSRLWQRVVWGRCQALNLSWTKRSGSIAVKSVAVHYRSLVSIDLGGCTVSPSALGALLSACPKLAVLRLSQGADQLSQAVIKMVMRCTELRVLCLSFSNLDLAQLKKICLHCRKLDHLNISGCDHISQYTANKLAADQDTELTGPEEQFELEQVMEWRLDTNTGQDEFLVSKLGSLCVHKP